jgi:hypothetical protein
MDQLNRNRSHITARPVYTIVEYLLLIACACNYMLLLSCGLHNCRHRPALFGHYEGAIVGFKGHTVARTVHAVARRADAIAKRGSSVARDPATVRGDDDTSSNKSRGRENKTCSQRKSNETTGTLDTTAATSLQEHGAGATKTTGTGGQG